MKRLAGTALLMAVALVGRGQSTFCASCPVLQGLPDTLAACKQATFAMPIPFVTNIQPGTSFFDILWTATPASAASISNPFGLTPAGYSTNVTVQFQPVKMKLQVRTIRNSISIDSNFNGGNSSFTTPNQTTTGYQYNATSVSAAGTYAVTTNPTNVNNIYSSFGDHTTGTGNMMVVNGSPNANTPVWCQTYNVEPCADYRMEFWATSATTVSPAALRLRVNGQPFGQTLNLTTTVPTWLSSTQFITSNSSGTMQVCIMNNNTAGPGNDFALDDITFRPMCRLEDSTYIDVQNLRPRILDSTALGCNGDTVFFKADTQSFPGIPATWPDTWEWAFGDGTTSTQMNPVHVYQQQGVYTVRLRVLRTKTYGTQSVTCVDSALGQIDTRHPFNAGFTQDKDTICAGEEVTFTDTSSPANSVTIFWKYGDGDTALQDPNIRIYKHVYDSVGLFTVTLIATDNLGCTDTAFGSVLSVGQPPVSFTTSDTAFCAGGATIVNATVPPTYTTFAWDFGDGRIVVDSAQVRHAYTQGGTYTIKFTATHPVCPPILAFDTVQVFDLPRVNLGNDTTICPMGQPIQLRDLVVSNPAATTYLWNTGDATPSILVRHDGEYWLTATYGTNCQSTDSISIAKNCYLDIPNAFTPGSGGDMASYFLPRQLLSSGLRTFKMQVFNRWGQIIYQTTRIDGRGWDGKYNGVEQPTGTYLYFIDATFDNGAVERYEGNVTLLR